MKCFKQARPSLCGSEWKHNIRGHRLRNLQAEKIHAREITLNCTEQWRESALEATRSLGKHCVKDTLETYLHECSAQSLRKAACTGIPPLHVLKYFHYEPGCDTWFFLVLLHLSVPKSGIQCPLIVMSPHSHYTKLDLQEQSDCLKPNKDEKLCVVMKPLCVYVKTIVYTPFLYRSITLGKTLTRLSAS